MEIQDKKLLNDHFLRTDVFDWIGGLRSEMVYPKSFFISLQAKKKRKRKICTKINVVGMKQKVKVKTMLKSGLKRMNLLDGI